MQDRKPDRRNFLRRTAGPYIRVNFCRSGRIERASARPPITAEVIALQRISESCHKPPKLAGAVCESTDPLGAQSRIESFGCSGGEMTHNTTLHCRCGQVRELVTNTSPNTVNRVICLAAPIADELDVPSKLSARVSATRRSVVRRNRVDRKHSITGFAPACYGASFSAFPGAVFTILART
jgi:hypothetical protein